MISINAFVRGELWHGLTENNDYQVSGEICNVVVERVTDDVLSIGAQVSGSDQDDVTINLSDDAAARLVLLLAAALVEAS